jgi:hypothetical protein
VDGRVRIGADRRRRRSSVLTGVARVVVRTPAEALSEVGHHAERPSTSSGRADPYPLVVSLSNHERELADEFASAALH